MHYIVCNKCEKSHTVGYLNDQHREWIGVCVCGNQLAMRLVDDPVTGSRTMRTHGGKFYTTSTCVSALERSRLNDGSIIVWD